jgi:hypothetical protein
VPPINSDEVRDEEKSILADFTTNVVDSLFDTLRISLAQHAFRQCFPNLVMNPETSGNVGGGEEAINLALVRFTMDVLSLLLMVFQEILDFYRI